MRREEEEGAPFVVVGGGEVERRVLRGREKTKLTYDRFHFLETRRWRRREEKEEGEEDNAPEG